jgi:hypothetical protein
MYQYGETVTNTTREDGSWPTTATPDSSKKTAAAHRLVRTTFLGSCPNSYMAVFSFLHSCLGVQAVVVAVEIAGIGNHCRA